MGVLRDSIDKLALLVGSSHHFQEHVAAYTQDETQTRIYRVFAGADLGQKIEEIPRPFALIQIGARNASKIAQDVWDGEGFLTLKFASDLENDDAPSESLITFAEWCYDVLEDMKCQAGTDDNLNLREIEQEDEPTWTPIEDGQERPFLWASWRCRWARF